MTNPGTPPPSDGAPLTSPPGVAVPPPDPLEVPRLAEGDDQGHYYLAAFVPQQVRGETAYSPSVFGAGVVPSSYADLRGSGTEGYALVRTDLTPGAVLEMSGLAAMPADVLYLGRGINGAVPQAARTAARTRLGVRGQVSTAKDVVRFMLLDEAGAKGKPNRLQADSQGHLYVHLGDLRIDLAE